jgi:hypothetical protein
MYRGGLSGFGLSGFGLSDFGLSDFGLSDFGSSDFGFLVFLLSCTNLKDPSASEMVKDMEIYLRRQLNYVVVKTIPVIIQTSKLFIFRVSHEIPER